MHPCLTYQNYGSLHKRIHGLIVWNYRYLIQFMPCITVYLYRYCIYYVQLVLPVLGCHSSHAEVQSDCVELCHSLLLIKNVPLLQVRHLPTVCRYTVNSQCCKFHLSTFPVVRIRTFFYPDPNPGLNKIFVYFFLGKTCCWLVKEMDCFKQYFIISYSPYKITVPGRYKGLFYGSEFDPRRPTRTGSDRIRNTTVLFCPKVSHMALLLFLLLL
jgi:hypothetical protein